MNLRLRYVAPLLPAMAAMSFWYLAFLRDPLLSAVSGSDPWRTVCAFLTGVQASSTIATALVWRNPLRAWAWENAWEFLFLFQVAGNRRLDLYPFRDIVLLEDARLFLAAGSILLLVLGELSEEWRLRRLRGRSLRGPSSSQNQHP
jgi:hypothetical protein